MKNRKRKINFAFHGIIDAVINNHNNIYDYLNLPDILNAPQDMINTLQNSDSDLLRGIGHMTHNFILDKLHPVKRPWSVVMNNMLNMVKQTTGAKNNLDLLRNPNKTREALTMVIKTIPKTMPNSKIFNTFIGNRGNMV
jgi:hypothetical protein